MRSFNQNDQSLTRLYNSYPPIYNHESMPPQLGSEACPDVAFYPYAVVPGLYTFSNLLPGTYTVTETQPVDFDGEDAVGTVNGSSRGALVAPDGIRSIELTYDDVGID